MQAGTKNKCWGDTVELTSYLSIFYAILSQEASEASLFRKIPAE